MSLIYIVDADPDIRRSLSEIVRGVGHESRAFGAGREALEAIEAQEERTPDLIGCDIDMADIDGIEFLIRLYGLEPGLPVVAVSGGDHPSGEQALENARNLGAVATLTKPFSGSEAEEAVDAALGSEG